MYISLSGTEEGEVSVVASQLRGYGVWDGAMGQDGTLLAGCTGPAPSLLFLWVTDAQANLLQTELTAIQTSGTASGILLPSALTLHFLSTLEHRLATFNHFFSLSTDAFVSFYCSIFSKVFKQNSSRYSSMSTSSPFISLNFI